jgi:hypothetical protein
MAQINKPDEYFNTVLWTGNGTTATGITGVGFQPDWTWIKERSQTRSHVLFDVIRGATVQLNSNDTAVDATVAESLQSFDSDGFTVGNATSVNQNGETYVGWNWLASNTTASNTDGDITSSVSANTTAGFSIVTYTTSSSGTDTVGHGLGVKPDVLITKSRDNAYNWDILHKSINDNGVGRMIFTTSAYSTGSSPYANTTPTASVFSFNANFYGASDNVTYCFAEKKGFSKFGSYTGNGSADGPFIYTGFKPSFLLIKRTDAAYHWYIHDNKRNPFNVMDKELYPSQSSAEGTAVTKDFLSNGIKIRGTQVSQNASGGNYIYMAFAENPLVGTNNIPATAR